MNIIRSGSLPIKVRGAAVSALKFIAGPEERVFLQELKNSDIPGLFDPAFETLRELERNLQMEEKMIYSVSAEDISIETLFEDEFEPESGTPPLVTILKEDVKSALINGTKIDFGPVSGRIFYFLAKNSSLGKYHTVEEIKDHMILHSLYLENSSIRNRISDLRARIRTGLEGRIDPNALIENARRYGYRVRAEVELR